MLMKKTKLLLSAVMAALLLTGCTQTDAPADTGETPVSGTSDTADTSTPAAETAPPAPFDPAADPYRGTAVNIDGDAIYHMSNYFKGDLTNLEDKCEQWFNRLYKNAGVSDLLYNVNFVVPTDSWMEYQDFYVRSLTTGEPLHETTEKLGKLYNTVYNEMKTDPYRIWIDLCYENGIHPWISFRMNDVHFASNGYGDSDFFLLAKEKGWCIGRENGRDPGYKWCLDYSVPEVRDHFSAYIDELLGQYDVYGIELDWMRNIHCFKQTSADNCKYMDEFMQKINQTVEKYEKQYGHDIQIMVRLSRDLDQNMYFGFDLRTWAKNGWLDVAVPSSRMAPTDSDMPIDVWKAELSPYGVEVYAGLEYAAAKKANQNVYTLAAYTSMYLQRGADKIYLYNLFNRGPDFYRVCSSLEAAQTAAQRSYLVTSQDTVPAAAGIAAYNPLPCSVPAGRQITDPIVLRHGRMNESGNTYIYLGIPDTDRSLAEQSNLTVLYNGTECLYRGEAVTPFLAKFHADQCYLSFEIPKEAWETAEIGEITFQADASLNIDSIELMNGLPMMG